ncbi:unnamed protein product [Meloidogyne enterolobii]|uniref:Uncharacterized protein n=1 Tax=Meloidogyne enterolobii TaxID=390850 RepID=A0ACB0Y9M1_MELEN
MVKEIKLDFVVGSLLISERAQNIERNIDDDYLMSTEYQLSNKYNSEMKFSICNTKLSPSEFKAKIKRIN